MACRITARVLVASALSAAAQATFATSAEPEKDLKVDTAPCLAAAAASDDDKIIAVCGPLIANAKTEKIDRLKALLARAAAYQRKDSVDSAIADYDAALMLDAAQADVLNTRGELWRRKGDQRKALSDFSAALKLNPDHAAARANHKALAQELERAGALIAVKGKPSFNCATARRAVEKAICANPELADLDREIYGSFVRVVREARDPREARAVQREQDEFIARRNAQFGKPGYDLQKAMRERLQKINGVDGY
ncbi:tetratricopeptide repeat protein [Bradyrhizobium lablabi]|uniref:tetratricopeptide repeat protein n=1 Tax=Bradyrhizobium lablabi TaxID=722472 RepID=UPI0020120D20|nr:tetratricopeptide repeat protein [Bradyrhizobium lablabi]